MLFRAYKCNLSEINRQLQHAIHTFSKNASSEEQRLVKRDIIACMYKYGISMDEYFLFDFQALDHSQRKTYLTTFNRVAYYALLNDWRHDGVFTNKYATYKTYREFYKRRVLLLAQYHDNLDEFQAFVRDNPRFIYKPLSESCGKGVRIIDPTEFSSPQELYHSLRKNAGVAEELIIQDERLGQFHPSSVNTIRMPQVINRAGETVIFSPVLRVGQKNSIVDNAGAGGILANIDPNTGVVYTDGADEFGNRYTRHPQTNVTFKGFVIPRWDEAVCLVKELSRVLPTVRYIGWDLALTRDGWVVVEGNVCAEFKVLQIADKRGLRDSLCKMI